MAVMYPYFLYANTRRRSSELSEFNEGNPKYFLCGRCHAATTTLILNSLTILICLISISFLTAGVLIPDSHQYMNNPHINLEYANHQQKFRLFYKITLSVLLAGSCVHFMTCLACVAGIRFVRPNLIIAELIVCGLFVGLVLFATISTVICMIIILGFMWSLTIAATVIVFYASLYFYSLILTYRYVYEKRRSWSHSRRNSPNWGKTVNFVD